MLLDAARILLADAMPTIQRRGITLIGLTFTNLFSDDAVQLALPLNGSSTSAIDATIDGLRDRFGSSSVTRAVLLGRGEGIHWPELDEDISVEALIAGRPSGESQQSFATWLRARG